MAKKKEKTAAKEETVQTADGDADDDEVADDNSPEAYALTGDYRVDCSEICKRSEIDSIAIKSRPQTPELVEGAPTTFVTKEKFEYLRPAVEVEADEENKDSIKSMFIKGWKVSPQLLNVLNLAAPQTLTSLSFWRCGLDETALETIVNMLSKLSVRNLALDGNPQCAGHFHTLLTEECTVAVLSLRSNKITCDDLVPFCAALSTNKSLTSLSLHNNNIADEGAKHIAQGLRLNRTLLTLNLGSNKITDVGSKHLSSILTSLTLTHEEIVARRKLISENKSSLASEDPPTTPGGKNKERPGSNSRTGSHTALDKKGKGGASGKGVKKQDKVEKPGTKDGRKSDMGNKGKDDKRKGGSDTKSKSKIKGGAGKKHQEEKEQEPEVVEFENPLLEGNLSEQEGKIIVPGNYALTCLNLNNNSIADAGIAHLYKALHYQDHGTMKRGIKGLLRLTLKNNCFDENNRFFAELSDMMMRRDPFYEQPIIEEDRSNVTAQT